MAETWRLLDVEYRDDPFMNMSVEEAIPRAVGEGEAPNTVSGDPGGPAFYGGRGCLS